MGSAQIGDYILLLCLLMLSGINIYLVAHALRSDERGSDSGINKLFSAELRYLKDELSNLARMIRVGQMAEQLDEKDMSQIAGPLAETQQASLQDVDNNSADVVRLLNELSGLKGKDIETWRDENHGRMQALLQAHSQIHQRLLQTQDMLDKSNAVVGRLSGSDARARALESVQKATTAELSQAKHQIDMLKADLFGSRKLYEDACAQFSKTEADFKQFRESAQAKQQSQVGEKAALEVRIDTLQRAAEKQTADSAGARLRDAMEQFDAERAQMADEQAKLQRKLVEAQEKYERIELEKTFIESTLVDLDESVLVTSNPDKSVSGKLEVINA